MGAIVRAQQAAERATQKAVNVTSPVLVVVPLVREVRRWSVVADNSSTSLANGWLPNASARVSTVWSDVLLEFHAPVKRKGNTCRAS